MKEEKIPVNLSVVEALVLCGILARTDPKTKREEQLIGDIAEQVWDLFKERKSDDQSDV